MKTFELPLGRILRQSARGLPYLKKELGRKCSLAMGKVLTAPSAYYIIFGGRCNLDCPFCSAHQQIEPSLSEEVVLRVLKQAKKLSGSGFNISLSGGEPLLYQPLRAMLELSQRQSINFGFTTNGLALTKARVREILSFNPFNINISIESANVEVNELLRPLKGGTARTLDGIAYLVEEKERIGARTGFMVKPTIMEQNYRTLPDLVRHFGKQSKVQINFQSYSGDKTGPFWVKDTANLKAVCDELVELKRQGYPVMGDEFFFQGVVDYFNSTDGQNTWESRPRLDLQGKKRNCDIGLRSLFVMANGDVFSCTYLGKPIGNVHAASLREIYHGDLASQQRAMMVRCDINCQQTCVRPIPLAEKIKAFLRMG